MKTRTSKENAPAARKPKKCARKDRQQRKELAEPKKGRPPVQQNRFTNILELSTLSASLMQLHDLLGTLVLDFAQDPVTVKISDFTGNYELNVSKESLSEFKMKVLMGQNSRGKPAFTIFLGECQCYPELPEGALEWSDNREDSTGSQIDSIGNDSKTEVNNDGVMTEEQVSNTVQCDIDSQPSNDVEEAACNHEILEPDDIQTAAEKNLVTYETHHISVSECSKMTPLSNSDELIVKMRPKRVCSKIKGPRSQKHLETAARRVPKKRSSYRSNLEGFVKFLMTDKVCGSLLDKMKAPENVVQLPKRLSGQRMVNYSDGKEYRVLFSQDKDMEEDVKTKASSHTDRPSSSREAADETESTGGGGIQVLFERPKPFEKSAFVEQVKKELEEWQARDGLKRVPRRGRKLAINNKKTFQEAERQSLSYNNMNDSQSHSYKKCPKKKKKKRFERPRYRLPFIDEIRAQLSNHKIHVNLSDDKIALKTDSIENLTNERIPEEKSCFTDAVSDTGIGVVGRPGDESSSTFEEPFYDAAEIIENPKCEGPSNVSNRINLRLKLDGTYLNVTVDDRHGTNFVKILREDLENFGADWTILSGNNGILTMNFNLTAEPQRKIDSAVQTAVVLGAEEISETEEASVLTSKANKMMDPISEEEPATEAYMVSEMSEDCLQTFDSAQEMKSSEKGSLENLNDLLEENQAKPKPLTDSTVSSIPTDTFTSERGRGDVSPSGLDSRTVLNTYSDGPPSMPLIKSKSDSLVVSRRAPKKKYERVNRKDIVQPVMYSSMCDRSEYGEWEYSIEKTHNLGFCSSDWIDEKTYLQYEDLTERDVPSRFQEETQERPMTSAADAVKSMHQALKPINDQINDIRTKMIGMNIQPRAASRPSQMAVPDLPPQESSYSIHSRINRWLVTDPLEFSSSMTTSDGSVRGYDYLEDIPVAPVAPKNRFGKLVIFPGDLKVSDGAFTRNVLDDLSWTRSSIVTEPEDLTNERSSIRVRKSN